MKKSLASRLKAFKHSHKKLSSEHINASTSNLLMCTDEEVALIFALRAKKLRMDQNRTQSDIATLGNFPASAYSAFERTGKISLHSFIKTVRALGRLDELSNLLLETVSDKIKAYEKTERARVTKVRSLSD